MHFGKSVSRFRVDGGKQVVLYNPLSGALDVLPRDVVERIERLCAQGGGARTAAKGLGYLVSRGHIYPSEAHEAEAIARGFNDFRERESRSNLRFVLLPTLLCNARCAYCFIGKSGSKALIGDRFLDDAFAAMDAISEDRGRGCTKQLTLFGGEPLIDRPPQREVLARILEMSAKRGFEVDIVSNGLDLEAYAELLARTEVSQVQVTFDGPQHYHDERHRPVDGRGPSFARIVAGVEAALSRRIHVEAQLLLDRNSIEMLPELVRVFAARGWFADDHFTTRVSSVSDWFHCQSTRERLKYLGGREGYEKLRQICRREPEIGELLALDWLGVGRLLSTGRFFPPSYRTCFGGTRTFAFDPTGGIYICETTAGRPEYRIGTYSPELRFDPIMADLLARRNVLSMPECRECKQALLCAGGCVCNAYVERGSYAAPGCRMVHETIEYGLDCYWPQIELRLQAPYAPPAPRRRSCSDSCCSTPLLSAGG
jgi:uncharacterized protein